MITLLTLAVAVGLSPYIPLLVFFAAARTDSGPEIRSAFDFMMRWEFLGVLLVVIGFDIVLGKLPKAAKYMTWLGWFAKPVAATLIVASSSDVSAQYLAPAIAAAIALAALTHRVQIWLMRSLTERLLGFERVVVGAYSELGTVLISLFAFVVPLLGAVIAGLMIAVGLFFGMRRPHSES
ncbi:MAG: DUF4126 domain-containing protein [Gammaproteobacteria bacterium]|nr:DUF4126 domain-containing protein [Gammaproteobacteria bacterium]